MFLYLCPYELAAEKVSKWTVNHAEFIFLPGGFAGANSITTIHEESNSKNLIVSGYLSRYPQFPLINNMFHLPAPLVQFPRNPFPVTFPWESLGADNH